MRRFTYATALVTCMALMVGSATAQEGQIDETSKRAQTGMKFLRMSVDARAAGMANALTAMEGTSTAMFYNPAGMARLSSNASLSLGQVQWFQDIGYNYGSLAFNTGSYGVVGVMVMAVDYGDFLGTVRADNEAGYTDTGTFSPTAIAVGLGYANALSDRFAIGANAKFVRQDLKAGALAESGSSDADAQSVIAFDFGVLYKTGFRSLNFAMSARNFSREVTFEDESFELPLTFTIGVSMNMLDLTAMDQNMHSLVLSVDAERPRDFYEHLRIGGEYTFMNTFSLRGGYAVPTDEEGFNLGLGVKQDISGIGLGADYAFTDFGLLGNVQRISLKLSF